MEFEIIKLVKCHSQWGNQVSLNAFASFLHAVSLIICSYGLPLENFERTDNFSNFFWNIRACVKQKERKFLIIEL
jgi:hypothetical protein